MILTIEEFVVENIFLCHFKLKLIVILFLVINKSDTHTNDTFFSVEMRIGGGTDICFLFEDARRKMDAKLFETNQSNDHDHVPEFADYALCVGLTELFKKHQYVCVCRPHVRERILFPSFGAHVSATLAHTIVFWSAYQTTQTSLRSVSNPERQTSNAVDDDRNSSRESKNMTRKKWWRDIIDLFQIWFVFE